MKSDLATNVSAALAENLTLSHLDIIDDSAKHKKHKHFSEGKKYFTLKISAVEFNDKSLLECHRMIYCCLDELMPNIHALSIQIIKGS